MLAKGRHHVALVRRVWMHRRLAGRPSFASSSTTKDLHLARQNGNHFRFAYKPCVCNTNLAEHSAMLRRLGADFVERVQYAGEIPSISVA
jgi:hypothetical protein